MKIFPAIDIKDQKCVRLVKGDFDNKTEYEMSPIEQAGKYNDYVFKKPELNIVLVFLVSDHGSILTKCPTLLCSPFSSRSGRARRLSSQGKFCHIIV